MKQSLFFLLIFTLINCFSSPPGDVTDKRAQGEYYCLCDSLDMSLNPAPYQDTTQFLINVDKKKDYKKVSANTKYISRTRGNLLLNKLNNYNDSILGIIFYHPKKIKGRELLMKSLIYFYSVDIKSKLYRFINSNPQLKCLSGVIYDNQKKLIFPDSLLTLGIMDGSLLDSFALKQIFSLENLKVLLIFSDKQLSIHIDSTYYRSLEYLSVNIDILDEQNIQAILSMPNLKKLIVDNCCSNIDNPSISKLKYLEEVYISHISHENFNALKANFPMVNFRTYGSR